MHRHCLKWSWASKWSGKWNVFSQQAANEEELLHLKWCYPVYLEGPSFWWKAHDSRICFLSSCGATWVTLPFISYCKRGCGRETSWPIIQMIWKGSALMDSQKGERLSILLQLIVFYVIIISLFKYFEGDVFNIWFGCRKIIQFMENIEKADLKNVCLSYQVI